MTYRLLRAGALGATDAAGVAGDPYVHCNCRGGFGPTPMGCSDSCACQRQALGGPLDLFVAGPEVKRLQIALNRFTKTSPPLTQPIKVDGVLSLQTATAALVVLLARAKEASLSFGAAIDRAGELSKILKEVGGGFADPIRYVNDHLAQVIQIVNLYADAKGLPAGAQTIISPRAAKGILGGAAILAAYLLLRR